MCHDMCKCFGRVGENREGMEVMRLFVSLKAVVYFDLFQSTLPRRERLKKIDEETRQLLFRSTLRCRAAYRPA